ncbi:MAG TPA: hypothetical protein PLN13_11800 [Bacteroidia bacterium]|nr:hypothetical protein [Bacteroidia bacterium]HRH09258.1 hypothetical protein [Bacteroidia bacterium]
MDIKLIRKIFGEMPIEYLPAAKIAKNKKLRNGIMIGIGIAALAAGFWGGTMWQKRKYKDFKLPEPAKKEAENLNERPKEVKAPAKRNSSKEPSA